jgi:hypothetical protein
MVRVDWSCDPQTREHRGRKIPRQAPLAVYKDRFCAYVGRILQLLEAGIGGAQAHSILLFLDLLRRSEIRLWECIEGELPAVYALVVVA